MRLFFMFAPAFIEWPFAIARELKKSQPDVSVCGIYRGGKDVLKQISSQTEIAIEPLYSQADLEEQWLDTRVDNDELATLESRFSPGFFKRVLVSDRKMGYGYVTGGVIPPNPLIKMSMNSEKVQRYFYGMATFLERTLLDQKITHVFCYAVAGSVAFVLRELCFLHGIRFRQIVHTRVETNCILDDASPILAAPVFRLYQKALENPSLVENAIPRAKNYLEELRNNPTQPGYMVFRKKQLERQTSLFGILYQLYCDIYGVASALVKRPKQDLEKTSEWDLLVFNLQLAWRRHRLKRDNPFHRIDQIPQRPYAYFPLHVSPEASTMILSPMHVDQVQVIEAISKSIPLSWNLLVKEHFPMLGKRPDGFYDRLRRIPGVYLVQPWENNFELVENSQMVCTITGTVGWEALILGKPFVVFGNAPYTVLEQGMVSCPDLSSLPQAIQKALVLSPIDERRLLTYVAAIYTIAFPFPSNLLWGKVTRDDVDANPNITRAFVKRIQSDDYFLDEDG